jgi:prophage maintenance system killer protein
LLNYLSVHDFVWINSAVTGTSVPFDFEKLEASMAAQYGYGKSNNAAVQAANLLETMLTNRPFERGNMRTAFIAVVTFMAANKYALHVDDKEAATILSKTAFGETSSTDAISAHFQTSELALRSGASLRALFTYVCNEHTEALRMLAEGD